MRRYGNPKRENTHCAHARKEMAEHKFGDRMTGQRGGPQKRRAERPNDGPDIERMSRPLRYSKRRAALCGRLACAGDEMRRDRSDTYTWTLDTAYYIFSHVVWCARVHTISRFVHKTYKRV